MNPDDLFAALGIPDPVVELAQIIYDHMDLGSLNGPGPLEENAALAVLHWHRAHMLEHEEIQTAAQDWFDRNAYGVLPDWPALRHILTGNRLQDGAA